MNILSSTNKTEQNSFQNQETECIFAALMTLDGKEEIDSCLHKIDNLTTIPL
jgi:hypothetical protein